MLFVTENRRTLRNDDVTVERLAAVMTAMQQPVVIEGFEVHDPSRVFYVPVNRIIEFREAPE